ncbi:4-hydroxythreonine-4-phosphate dehydrogenase PdxA [Halomonas halmophila]|uniref:4-hydroxythreonine-4-phosphate dehydrogenase n=1 Tax=Halomonas halmophila TaxID=252 RepID=A0A4Y4EW47_9GAMM|nr:4-hydroxythreonine-4-phosphate dehydrogenase PdxA [Halomonas halmophila]GED21346.1 4-hydroxythreonine-4-phosphate dehydrogenase 1 [Halomonas halmophila]
MNTGDLPVIALTTGEPAGIGPELAVMLACCSPLSARVVAVGDPALLAERAAAIGHDIRLHVLAPNDTPPAPEAGVLPVWPVALRAPSVPGRLDTSNAAYVLETLNRAVEACRAGAAAAMVTAPLHKGVIIEAGHGDFRGHTEYLRDACGVDDVVMMLATDSALHARHADWPAGHALRVALATTHLPLRDVADAVTAPRLTRMLSILDAELRQRFGLPSPRILVCGLNPHAGEDGHLGHEERDIIEPALEALREQGLSLTGPLPADTLFTPRHLMEADAVLAMYHDQGLPVLKYAGFGRAANITLGLPLVRTSVDHGTALDLAGRGAADPGSLRTAVALAIQMVHGGASSPQ